MSSLAKRHTKQSWQETPVSVPGQDQHEETDKTDTNQRQEDESYLDNRTKRNLTSTVLH